MQVHATTCLLGGCLMPGSDLGRAEWHAGITNALPHLEEALHKLKVQPHWNQCIFAAGLRIEQGGKRHRLLCDLCKSFLRKFARLTTWADGICIL
eukprot:1781269-Rhodomonas_salina.3